MIVQKMLHVAHAEASPICSLGIFKQVGNVGVALTSVVSDFSVKTSLTIIYLDRTLVSRAIHAITSLSYISFSL